MKMLLAIAGFALSVVLIAESGFALPRASSVEGSQAVELVGFGCNFIDGKLVCGKSESSDDADDEDNHKHKKKANDTDSELTECTIQQSEGGGGCVKGFKHVCEKLKSGKKCCGCVPDKNAPKVQQFCCSVAVVKGAGTSDFCDASRAEAERQANLVKAPGEIPDCFAECFGPKGDVSRKYCH